jgi:hypothetical protein
MKSLLERKVGKPFVHSIFAKAAFFSTVRQPRLSMNTESALALLTPNAMPLC